MRCRARGERLLLCRSERSAHFARVNAPPSSKPSAARPLASVKIVDIVYIICRHARVDHGQTCPPNRNTTKMKRPIYFKLQTSTAVRFRDVSSDLCCGWTVCLYTILILLLLVEDEPLALRGDNHSRKGTLLSIALTEKRIRLAPDNAQPRPPAKPMTTPPSCTKPAGSANRLLFAAFFCPGLTP